jgi:hypothetical protein
MASEQAYQNKDSAAHQVILLELKDISDDGFLLNS